MPPEVGGTAPSGEAPSPFAWRCPACAADVDSPDHVFEVGPPALVPAAAYALLELTCHTCGLASDVALWVGDRDGFQASLSDGPAELLGDGRAQRALLERYAERVEEACARWDALRTLDPAEAPAIEYDRLALDLTGQRLVAVPAEALASARGLREWARRHPGQPPPGLLRMERFTYALSLEAVEGRPWPWQFHLSVMNTLVPGSLSRVELELALSLFIAPDERAAVRAEPGWNFPVTHFYVPWSVPDVERG